MSRTATAASPLQDDETTVTRVDQLVQRGRGQGHLSLPELRSAFEKAGISATEGRSILRELAEAGVQLGNEAAEAAGAKQKGAPADAAAATDAAPDEPDGLTLPDHEETAAVEAEAEAAALASPDSTSPIEADLDDQTPAMGDSVHTYLKSIGRTSLLTAEQEVDLAKRIEAGLFAEHKLENEPDLDEAYRRDLRTWPRTAGGPRPTCSRPTCAWWSRWPRSTATAA
jgi:RNA polymerase primary sigma factor